MPRQTQNEDDDDLSTIAPEEDAYLENFALDDPPEEEAAPTDEPTGNNEDLPSASPQSFPGSHPLSLKQLVKRAHEGLGHPHLERFIRILRHSRASPEVIQIAKEMKCNVCEAFRRTRPARTAAPPREIGVNEAVGVDSVRIYYTDQCFRNCLNIIDYHTITRTFNWSSQ